MSATTAEIPYSTAASFEHYNKKTLNELKVLAKLHTVSDAGEPQDIVARLMESDRKNNTWPGKHEASGKKNGEGSSIALIKQVSTKAETPSETEATIGEKSNNASTSMASMTATGSKNDTAISMLQLAKDWDGAWGPPFAFAKVATVESKSQGTSVTTAISPTRSKSPDTLDSPVSPVSPVSSISSKSNRYNVLVAVEEEIGEPEKQMMEAVEEDISATSKDMEDTPSLDQEWVAASAVSQKEDEEEKEHRANKNTDSGEKTKKKQKRSKKGEKKVKKTKTDAAQSAETETDTTEVSISDAADILERAADIPLPVSPTKSQSDKATPEPAIHIFGPSSVIEEDNDAIVEASPSVTLTKADESVGEQPNLDESKSIDTEKIQKSRSPIETLVPEQLVASPLAAAPSERTTQPTEKAAMQIFPVAPPPPSTQTAPSVATTPNKTKNQRRNEKRKENKRATSSNLYNVLVPDQSVDTPTPDSSNTKEDENKDDGEGTAPAAKKNKRGTKGGKKAQAQKKKQPVPVDETTAALVIQAVVAAKIEPMHVAMVVVVVVIVAILAGALSTWARI